MFLSAASCTKARTCSVSVLSHFPEFLCNIVSCMNFIWIEAWWNGPLIFTFTLQKTCIFPLRLNATSISPVCHVSWSLCWVSLGTEHVHHGNKNSSIVWVISLFPAAAHGLWIVTSCVFVDAAGLGRGWARRLKSPCMHCRCGSGDGMGWAGAMPRRYTWDDPRKQMSDVKKMWRYYLNRFFRRTLRLGALGKKYDFEAVGKRNCTRTMISAKDYKITKGIIIATPLGAATPMRFTTRSCKTQ